MAASASDIRAGGAFVELYLKGGHLVEQGLDGIAHKTRAFTTALSTMATVSNITIGHSAAAIRTSLTTISGVIDKTSKAIQTTVKETAKVVTATLDAMPKAINKTGKALESIGSKGLFTGLLAGGAGAATMGHFMEFERQMQRVKALTGATGGLFEEMTAKARELGRTTQYTSAQAAEGMAYLAMAGLKARDAIDVLPVVLNLATAAQMDLGMTADIITDIGLAFGYTGKQTQKVADIITQAATNSNTTVEMMGTSFKYLASVTREAKMPLEDIATLLALLAQTGIKANTAGTNMREAIINLVTPAKRRKIEDILGVRIADARGEFRPIFDIIDDLERSLNRFPTTKRLELMSQIFGKRGGNAMLSLINQGGAARREKQNIIYQNEGATDRMAGTMRDSLWGNWKEFVSVIQDVQISIGTALVPAIRGLLDHMTSGIRIVNEWISNHKKWVVGVSLAVPALIAAGGATLVLGKALTTVATIINPVVSALSAGINGIAVAIAGATGLMGVFSTALMIVASGIQSVAAVMQSTVGMISMLSMATAGAVVSMTLMAKLPLTIVEGIKYVVGSLMSLGESITKTYNAMTTVAANTAMVVSEVGAATAETAAKVLNVAADIAKASSDVGKASTQMLLPFASAADAGSQLFLQFVDIADVATDVTKAVSNVAKASTQMLLPFETAIEASTQLGLAFTETIAATTQLLLPFPLLAEAGAKVVETFTDVAEATTNVVAAGTQLLLPLTDIVDVMGDVANATSNVVEAATQLTLPFMNAAEGTSQLVLQFTDFIDVTTDVAQIATGTSKAATQMMFGFMNAAEGATQLLLPLTDVIETTTKTTGVFATLGATLAKIGSNVANFASTIGSGLATIGVQAAMAAGQILLALVPIATALAPILLMGGMIYAMYSFMKAVILGLIEAVKNLAVVFWQATQSIAVALGSTLLGSLNAVGHALGRLIGDIGNYFKKNQAAIAAWGQSCQTVFGQIYRTFTFVVKALQSGNIEDAMKLIKFEAFRPLEHLEKFARELLVHMLEEMPKVMAWLGDILTEMFSGIGQSFTDLWTTIKQEFRIILAEIKSTIATTLQHIYLNSAMARGAVKLVQFAEADGILAKGGKILEFAGQFYSIAEDTNFNVLDKWASDAQKEERNVRSDVSNERINAREDQARKIIEQENPESLEAFDRYRKFAQYQRLNVEAMNLTNPEDAKLWQERMALSNFYSENKDIKNNEARIYAQAMSPEKQKSVFDQMSDVFETGRGNMITYLQGNKPILDLLKQIDITGFDEDQKASFDQLINQLHSPLTHQGIDTFNSLTATPEEKEQYKIQQATFTWFKNSCEDILKKDATENEKIADLTKLIYEWLIQKKPEPVGNQINKTEMSINDQYNEWNKKHSTPELDKLNKQKSKIEKDLANARRLGITDDIPVLLAQLADVNKQIKEETARSKGMTKYGQVSVPSVSYFQKNVDDLEKMLKNNPDNPNAQNALQNMQRLASLAEQFHESGGKLNAEDMQEFNDRRKKYYMIRYKMPEKNAEALVADENRNYAIEQKRREVERLQTELEERRKNNPINTIDPPSQAGLQWLVNQVKTTKAALDQAEANTDPALLAAVRQARDEAEKAKDTPQWHDAFDKWETAIDAVPEYRDAWFKHKQAEKWLDDHRKNVSLYKYGQEEMAEREGLSDELRKSKNELKKLEEPIKTQQRYGMDYDMLDRMFKSTVTMSTFSAYDIMRGGGDRKDEQLIELRKHTEYLSEIKENINTVGE